MELELEFEPGALEEADLAALEQLPAEEALTGPITCSTSMYSCITSQVIVY